TRRHSTWSRWIRTPELPLLLDARIDHATTIPGDREAVAQPAQRAVADPVLRAARGTLPVVHRLLDDAQPEAAHQGRHEAVHAVEARRIEEGGARQHLHPARRVRDPVAGDPVAHRVADARADPANPGVLPAHAHADDAVAPA